MAYMLMSLRAVNHRLTNLPVKQLPHIASSLAASITECGELLSAPQSQKANKGDSDNAVQVHKLMTRLASLLQDRTCEGRWTAVVLVKALVEAGQWEILRGSEPFVRGLLSILAKSDPDSTKIMSVITLTRIFQLTYQYPTLVREITTPSLPGFITSTLNLISVKPSSEPTRKLKPNTPLLEVVLHAYSELIARHPTIFRPFTSQIHALLQAIISSTASSFPQAVVDLSEKLFVALHHCAPKNSSGEEWKNACRMTITSIHGTSNYVFRALVEQWESVDPTLRQMAHPHDYSQEVRRLGSDPLGLSGWQGLDSGVSRLVVLLRMLSTFLSTATTSTVTIPVGSILDMTSRLNSVTVPADASDVHANAQIGRTEREHLLSELPRIHVGCMKLLLSLVDTLETGIVPVAQTILEQAVWVFRAEKFSRDVRRAVYDLVRGLLSQMGPSMTKKNVSSLTDIFRACCSDLLPPQSQSAEPSSDSKGKSKSNQVTMNADSFLNPGLKQGRKVEASSSFPGFVQSASDLLPTVLTHIPIEFLPPPLRAEIDRTVIMTSDKKAMFASVLNPFPAVQGRGAGISIIPFLARSYPAEMDVEGLIRPRMPVLTSTNGIGQYNGMEDEEEEVEAEEGEEKSKVENRNTFTLNTLLQSTGPLKPSSTPDLMEVDVAQRPALPINKRQYAEEQGTTATSSDPTRDAKEGMQAKKVRFESNGVAAPAPSSPSQTSAASAAFTRTSVLSSPQTTLEAPTAPIQLSPANNLSMPSERGSSQAAAPDSAPTEEDSDDEMPTLNLESDTDDDDDDEE